MAFISSAKKLRKRYDAIIVGSGAAGGICAHVLTGAGLKVLLLEAGRKYDPTRETPMFQSNAAAPLRAASTPERPNGYFFASKEAWTVEGQPYVVKDLESSSWREGRNGDRGRPDQNFMWFRSRMLGGRTHHWGRVSLRMGPYDFKPKTRDGLGFDWPIEYADVAPYYDKVDQLVGIFGSVEGLENNPDSQYFLPPPKPRLHELIAQQAGKKMDVRFIANRAAVLTRPMNGRGACLYATPCGRGCAVNAGFQSTILIETALRTGNLDVLTDTLVREVVLDARGLATGVHFVDVKTGAEGQASADAVVLGASSAESARILLNSRSTKFPQGLGNSSGHVGRWLTDSAKSFIHARLPQLEGLAPENTDGMVDVPHLYAPWMKWSEQKAGKLGFPRGYSIAVEGGGRGMPALDNTGALLSLAGDAYGSGLKKDMRRYYGSLISVAASGEMIPNDKTYCELDPEKKDSWGIPVLRFHFERSEHELNMVAHQQQALAALVEAANGKLLRPPLDAKAAILAGGSTRHEVGVTRMSASEKDGVTNSWSQLWDCPNVVIGDGGVFVSNSFKNPTLTIMALAWRACDRLIDEMKKRNIKRSA